MKDAVIRFIHTLQSIFSNKRSEMGGLRFHAPYVKEIKEDEESLITVNKNLSQLKDENSSQQSALLLYFIVASVVPILRKWKNRFEAIHQKSQDDNKNHVKAHTKFVEQKRLMFDLINQLNSSEGTKLIEHEETNSDPAVAIIANFKAETFALKYQLSTFLQKNTETNGLVSNKVPCKD